MNDESIITTDQPVPVDPTGGILVPPQEPPDPMKEKETRLCLNRTTRLFEYAYDLLEDCEAAGADLRSAYENGGSHSVSIDSDSRVEFVCYDIILNGFSYWVKISRTDPAGVLSYEIKPSTMRPKFDDSVSYPGGKRPKPAPIQPQSFSEYEPFRDALLGGAGKTV